MIISSVVKGLVVGADKVSKKGNRYIQVYDGKSLINVFTNERYSDGEKVEIPCEVISDNCFFREATV